MSPVSLFEFEELFHRLFSGPWGPRGPQGLRNSPGQSRYGLRGNMGWRVKPFVVMVDIIVL